MVRKKDRFWEYAEDLKGRFKCKFCERDFAGGASRIKCHLAGVKGHDIDICTKVSKEVQEEASLIVGEPKKKLKSASTSNRDQKREINSTSISKDVTLSRVFEMQSQSMNMDDLLKNHYSTSFDQFAEGTTSAGGGGGDKTSSIQLSLQSLMFIGPDILDQIQYFIALKILWIEVNLVDLPEWLGNISSLQQLYLVCCWNLEHLPTKEAMQRLTQLRKLVIWRCPRFEHNERIKISHVPWVEINNSPLRPYCKDFMV